MSPRDFLEDSQSPLNMPQVGSNAYMPRDFLSENEEPKESLGESAALAIPRMLTDLTSGVYNTVQSIPGYWDKAKPEIKALLNPYGEWREHPLHLAGQALAGFAEEGQDIFNTPHDILNYAANRFNLFPKDWNEKVQMARMPNSIPNINTLLGTPKYAGESAIREVARNALPITGAVRLLQEMPHLTKRGATRVLRNANELAENRNIGSLNVDPQLIEDARQFLPNTLPYRNALNTAQTGDYNTLFRLQSDVGKNASDYARSFFSAAERAHGRAGLEARNRLLDVIHQNLQSQGHYDISSLLRKGQSDYRRYMVFKPYRNILAAATLGAMLPTNSLINIGKRILSHKTQ